MHMLATDELHSLCIKMSLISFFCPRREGTLSLRNDRARYINDAERVGSPQIRACSSAKLKTLQGGRA